jgi:hypothetical protein
MFDALEEAPPDVLSEEVPSHTSLNHPSSQIFDSTYTTDGTHHSSCNKPDYHRFAHMTIHSIQASCILLSRSIHYYIEEPTDMNFTYALLLDPDYGLIDGALPHQLVPVYKARKANVDPDTPDLATALSGPDHQFYKDAMHTEVQQLEDLNCWDVVAQSELPSGANILPGTWVFKLKQYPNGHARKYKACFCARGDLQIEGKD